jgi:ubiquinone/menaquinone biosynthesis C-methylase UbiE
VIATANGKQQKDMAEAHGRVLLRVEAEVDRLAAQAHLGWEKEARTLSWFGLRDGMSILEPGSGPGFATELLSTLFPNSPITCLELDPTLLKHAEQTFRKKANPRGQLREGSVMDIQLAENSFDFAYARLLFHHLPDPARAAKELWRVLKPGGRLVIYDIDDGIFGVTQPPIPELPTILKKFGLAQAAQGGNRHIGRNLWRILDAAGFTRLDLEVVPMHSDELGLEPFLPQIDPDRLLPLVQLGLMSAGELDEIRASRAKFLASPHPYILNLSLMICGEKRAE